MCLAMSAWLWRPRLGKKEHSDIGVAMSCGLGHGKRQATLNDPLSQWVVFSPTTFGAGSHAGDGTSLDFTFGQPFGLGQWLRRHMMHNRLLETRSAQVYEYHQSIEVHTKITSWTDLKRNFDDVRIITNYTFVCVRAKGNVELALRPTDLGHSLSMPFAWKNSHFVAKNLQLCFL